MIFSDTYTWASLDRQEDTTIDKIWLVIDIHAYAHALNPGAGDGSLVARQDTTSRVGLDVARGGSLGKLNIGSAATCTGRWTLRDQRKHNHLLLYLHRH